MDMLNGIRVLDLTRLYPGPFCTQLLADMGAEVIKVESPGEGDYMRKMGPMDGEFSHYFRLLNRRKKSITMNLKKKEGVEVFLRLAAGADIIIEGFRPGVMGSLGLGFEDVRRINPGIIYCSVTGYGQDGPYRDRAGHDINYIALAGILGITGEPGGPPVVPGVQIGDVGGGSLMALSAILAALVARSRSGNGCYLDVAMLDGLVAWLPLAAAEYFAGHEVKRGSAALNGGLACYGVYRTADGGYMSLGALEPKFWWEFCRAVGRPDLAGCQYQPDQAALRHEVAGIFASRTRREWEELFAAYDACCEPVLELGEVQEHPQVVARKMMEGHWLGFPIKIPGKETAAPGNVPRLGEHTAEILESIGFSQEEIIGLRNAGVL